MKQEDKELLLKDLSARLHYGVKVYHGGSSNQGIDTIGGYYTYIGNQFYLNESEYWTEVDELKPYLRPMSSMTEEEEEEYWQIRCPQYDENGKIINKDAELFDWLNAHHFDYRGLIEKGLALEAPEGMYNLKEK